MRKSAGMPEASERDGYDGDEQNVIICPFCGKESRSREYCSKCNTRLTKEALAVAYTRDNDPRGDTIGPFTTKVAKRLLWVLIALLLIAFVALTELQGKGFLAAG